MSDMSGTGRKPKAAYVLSHSSRDLIYGPNEQTDIAEMVEVADRVLTREEVAANPAILGDTEIILSGWGGPILDTAVLEAAPALAGFFYGAGATGGMIGPEVYERGIVVVSAADANAVPVAEFAIAAIIFALKQAFRMQRDTRAQASYPRPRPEVAGAYGSTVGLVSLGAIGRLVIERMRGMNLQVRVLAYDPFVSDTDFASLGVERANSIEQVFEMADVVSVHTPWLPETERLIRGSHIDSLKPGATLINTARGAVIAEDEMLDVLAKRPDLTAVLDVTWPEPPPPDSAMYTLPNVFLTPHIAGSLNAECRRMGRLVVDELRRFLNHEPLQHRVLPEASAHSSHRVRPS